MTEIWRTRDRLGRVVVLASEGRDHILHRCPKMAGRLEEVRAAIEQPTLVARDQTFPRRENHYRRNPAGQGWIKVVVNYRPIPPQGTWIGEVVTAYPIGRPEPKEEPLWP